MFPILTADAVRQLLDYDQATGVFRWRVQRGGRAAPGTVAGTPDDRGATIIRIGKRHFKAHRLAWLHVHGEWPSLDVDHIDGNPANNAISNLRLATMAQNLANAKRRKDNIVGLKGVSPRCDGKAFRARIAIGGRQLHLGSFPTAEEAHAAYMAAAERLFGEFARAA